MTRRPSISRPVFLVGFSGSGKSTVGPLLAQRMHVQFLDLDDLVAARTRMSITDIFARRGESGFRLLETAALKTLLSNLKRPAVIALGGGVVTRSINRALIGRSGVTVYLSCAERELYRRLRSQSNRPMFRPPAASTRGTGAKELRDRIRHLLSARRVYYEAANVRIATTARTPADTARRLVAMLEELDD